MTSRGAGGTPGQQAKLAAAREALAAATRGPQAAPLRRRDEQRSQPPPPEPEDADADPYAVARRIVLRQLTMAPRSRAELAEKLRQRDCPDDVAAAVLDRFEQVGLINDQLYAETLIRSRQEHRGMGRRAVSQELRRKGIDPELSKELLADVDEAGERARALELARARAKRLSGLDRAVQTRRLAGLLARKGYSSSLAMSVIREVLDQMPEHQRD